MKRIIDINEDYFKIIEHDVKIAKGSDYKPFLLIANSIPYEERPQGEWIPNYTSQFMNPGKQCSLCGKIVEFSENYCPKCGARMEIKNENV